MSRISLHPRLDNGYRYEEVSNFSGGTLKCLCENNPVEVAIKAQIMYNHACGCSKCWKPEGAIFSLVAVVGKENVKVLNNEDKLQIVDESAVIQRYACKDCGAHLFGRIENKDHAFYGLDFVHTELSNEKGWSAPEFAAFVSSVIETGTPASKMSEVRNTLHDVGLPTYDCLSPELMDLLAIKTAKLKGTYRD
ncbi:S-(hydroxymethyl)glutathione synthase [Brevibacillus sp. 179-C9.3 HS]|uniref:S-(hydroxymethyl)glutathione synthase n=1 Tax=unclassified Brevibacillus TaxID=2684853 RepID=UPI0039A202E9